MAKLVELQAVSGKALWVNPDHVLAAHMGNDGQVTWLYTTGTSKEGTPYIVTVLGTPDRIMAKLNGVPFVERARYENPM